MVTLRKPPLSCPRSASVSLHEAPNASTIVVVDDAPEVRALVRTRLRLSGVFDVVGEGGDGTAAVALAEQHRPQLMLLDVSMPGMDGLEALPRVLAVSPDTRVVVYSGFEEHGLPRRHGLGATGFIQKSERSTVVTISTRCPSRGDR